MPVLKSSLVAGMSAVVVATATGAVTPQVTHTNVPAVYAAPAAVSTYAEKYYLTASPIDLLGLPFQEFYALYTQTATVIGSYITQANTAITSALAPAIALWTQAAQLPTTLITTANKAITSALAPAIALWKTAATAPATLINGLNKIIKGFWQGASLTTALQAAVTVVTKAIQQLIATPAAIFNSLAAVTPLAAVSPAAAVTPLASTSISPTAKTLSLTAKPAAAETGTSTETGTTSPEAGSKDKTPAVGTDAGKTEVKTDTKSEDKGTDADKTTGTEKTDTKSEDKTDTKSDDKTDTKSDDKSGTDKSTDDTGKKPAKPKKADKSKGGKHSAPEGASGSVSVPAGATGGKHRAPEGGSSSHASSSAE
ncbi:hypothetical protein EB75_02000 [Mycobacterium sp. ST-F2]|uniref:hypothetical protein n=1 Tax=Mycobacterium sp. ST-F2 TaxID=1490484 RepID=UPI0009396D43|nr:hypothetical protein [Mycobacterium sp. ST-F2]OKH76844.1 hypothetical protein EB75_02000 [Mycobacterium sp. ST-F2]